MAWVEDLLKSLAEQQASGALPLAAIRMLLGKAVRESRFTNTYGTRGRLLTSRSGTLPAYLAGLRKLLGEDGG